MQSGHALVTALMIISSVYCAAGPKLMQTNRHLLQTAGTVTNEAQSSTASASGTQQNNNAASTTVNSVATVRPRRPPVRTSQLCCTSLPRDDPATTACLPCQSGCAAVVVHPHPREPAASFADHIAQDTQVDIFLAEHEPCGRSCRRLPL